MTTTTMERVRYFSRQLITAEDMRAEQDYLLQKLRRHNRMLHGFGVVCGLEVTGAADSTHPRRVSVSRGYALTPQGDEICLADTDFLDLAECGRNDGDPCLPESSSSVAVKAGDPPPDVFVAIRYDECPSRPVRVMPAGCGCGDSSCDYSRVRDGWKLACWPVPTDWKEPPPPAPSCPALVDRLLHCPAASTDCWVLLARVSFDEKGGVKNADNRVRTWIFSTSSLQGIVCSPANW